MKYGRHSKCNWCHEHKLFVADGKKSWTTTDCYKHLNDGIRASGVYTLYVGENQHKMSAYCDMETNGGGWTVCVIKSTRYDVGRVHVLVSNFLRYVSTKNEQNRMKSDKDVTKIKRVTFFLRHSVVSYL